MSEGDLVQDFDQSSIPPLSSSSSSNNHHNCNTKLNPTNSSKSSSTSSTPPRSRSQSAGSAHKEALLFFQQHKLFQSQNQDQDFLSLPQEWVDNSTEVSSFSKSPSPAHYSDIQSSSTTTIEEERFLHKSSTIRRAHGLIQAKSDNNLDEGARTLDDQSFNGTGTKVGCGEYLSSGDSPSRNRSIRGRSHSQPNQVILSTITSTASTSSKGSTTNKGCKRVINSRKNDTRNWLEYIQFTAEYKHLRTNDYASVVNSVSSLDQLGVDHGVTGSGKRSTEGISQVTPGEVVGRGSKTARNSSSPSTSNGNGLQGKTSGWKFSRLRRILNTKSLEDIFKNQRLLVSNKIEPEVEDIDIDDPSSSTATVTVGVGGATSDYSSDFNSKSKNSSQTSLKGQSLPYPSGNDQGPSTSKRVPASEEDTSKKDFPQSVSSSNKRTGAKVSSSNLTSTLASVLLCVPQFNYHSSSTTGSSTGNRSYTKKKLKKEKPSKSQSSGSLNQVSCAKSDNYLNCIVSSATCAKFTVGKSVDNLCTNNTNINIPNPVIPSSSVVDKKRSSSGAFEPKKLSRAFGCISGSTVVEPFEAASPSSDKSDPAKQRRWTAVKHKWDLKLQQSSNPENNTQNSAAIEAGSSSAVFVKSQLNKASFPDVNFSVSSGVGSSEAQLESLTSCTNASPVNPENCHPHEALKVSFRLEPEEIPNPSIPGPFSSSEESPTISRSQSGDIKPTEINPDLLLSGPSTEEESEEMTKARHFHYRDATGATIRDSSKHSRSRMKSEDGRPNLKSCTTMNNGAKDKAQLVVANFTFLARPTSPCIFSGDNLQQQSFSSIVFNNANNNNYNLRNPQESITSPTSNYGWTAQPASSLSNAECMRDTRKAWLNNSRSPPIVSNGTKSININSSSLFDPNSSRVKNMNTKSSIACASEPGALLSPTSKNSSRNVNIIKNETTGLRCGGGANVQTSLKGSNSGRPENFFLEDDDDYNNKAIYNKARDKRDNQTVTDMLGGAADSSRRTCADERQRRQGDCPSGTSPRIDSDLSMSASEALQRGGYLSDGDSGALANCTTTHFGPNQPQGIGFPGRYLSPETTDNSLGGNNNFQPIESDEEEIMGDLESPTYVKRTAQLFNSKYSSQHNGGASSAVSSTDYSKESRNPSYLNVSRSVSGYSCLSYNNGTSNGSTTEQSNGSSSSPYSNKYVSPPSTKVRSEFTVKVNQTGNPHSLSSNGKSKNTEDNRESDYRASPKSRFESSNLNDTDAEDSSAYVPSHGKSFIMQRIERLYGADAVSSTSLFSRKSTGIDDGGTVVPVKYESANNGTERIIPIKLEQDSQNNGNAKRCVAKAEPYERVIRGDEMLSDDIENKQPNSSRNSKMHAVREQPALHIGGVYEDVALEARPGKHRLVTTTLDDNDEDSQKLSCLRSPLLNDLCPSSMNGKTLNGDYSNGTRSSRDSSSSNKDDSGIVVDESGIVVDDQDQAEETELEDSKMLLDIRNIIKVSSQEESVGEVRTERAETATNEVKKFEQSVTQVDKENNFTPTSFEVLAKDGQYFLTEMNNVKRKLEQLIEKSSKDMEGLDPLGERHGNTLSAIGKSNLLMKKKFPQFEKLCDVNLNGPTEQIKETTNEDLAGFWDMVMIQVEQVYDLFKSIGETKSELDKGTEDGYKTKALTSPKKLSSSSSKPLKPLATKSESSAASKARDESRKKMLADRRRLMQSKAATTTTQEDVLIYTPESTQNS